MNNQCGGYYYDKNIIVILSEIVKKFIDTITKQNNFKFIDSDYTINVKKFEAFLEDYKDKNYDEIMQFIIAYYNPFDNFNNEKQQYIMFDYKGLPINEPNIQYIGMSGIEQKCIQIDENLVFQKYECPNNTALFRHRQDKLSYLEILQSLRMDDDICKNIHVINKWNIIQAALLYRYDFFPFFRQFSEMNPDIEELYDMFYNNFNELTSRPNPLKNMVDTATIHYFFELLQDENFMNLFNKLSTNTKNFLIMNNEFAKIEIENANTSKIVKDDWQKILESKNFNEKYIDQKEIIDTYKDIANLIYNKLESQNQRITNSISIKTIHTAFEDLKDMSLFVLVKSFCLSAINECEKIIKIINDMLINITKIKNKKIIDVFTYISNYEKVFFYDLMIKTDEQNQISLKNFRKILLEKIKQSKNLNETTKTFILNFGTYVDLIYMKTLINDLYIMMNPKSIFTMKYTDVKIGNQIKYVIENFQAYDGYITNGINLEEFTKEVQDTYQLYSKLIELLKKYLEELVSNNDYINDIDNVFYNLDDRFTTNANNIFFHKKIIKAIMSKIGNIPNYDYLDEITKYYVLFNRTFDFNVFVEKIPVFHDVLNKELGIYDTTNSKPNILFSTVLNKINVEIFSPNKRPINYYAIFITSLAKIFYLVNKINKYFTLDMHPLNVANTIPYAYVSKLLERVPSYSSINTVAQGLFGNLKITNDKMRINYDLISRIDNFLVPIYKSVGYNNASGVPDCMESAIRDLINILILEDNKLNVEKLPDKTIKEVRQFYDKYNTLAKHYSINLDEKLRTDWVKIFNTVIKNALAKKYPDHIFFHMDRNNEYQDIKSSFINFTNVLMIIFGNDSTTSLEYDNAKNDCSKILSLIIDKFQKNATIDFEGYNNKMIIKFNNKLVFDIHDGHSSMNQSVTDFKDLANIVINYVPQNMPLLIRLDDYDEWTTVSQWKKEDFPWKFVVFFYNNREARHPIFMIHKKNINSIINFLKICEKHKCALLFIKNINFDDAKMSYVYDILLSLPNIQKYLSQYKINFLYKIVFRDNYEYLNNSTKYSEKQINSFFDFVEAIYEKSDTQNKKKILKDIIDDNIGQLECLLAIFMEKKYNKNKIYGLFETALLNYKFMNQYTIDIIKMFFIPYRLQLFSEITEDSQYQEYDNFTCNYIDSWISNFDKINENGKKIIYSCDKPSNIVKAIKNKKNISDEILEEIRKAIIYNDGIIDNKLDINRVFTKFALFVVPFNLIYFLRYINPDIFAKLGLDKGKPFFVIHIIGNFQSQNPVVQAYVKKIAKEMRDEFKIYEGQVEKLLKGQWKGGSRSSKKIFHNNHPNEMYYYKYYYKYYKYKQKYLSLLNR